jgi:hypothetical protein
VKRLAIVTLAGALGVVPLAAPAPAQKGEPLAGVYGGYAVMLDEGAPGGSVGGTMHLYFPVRPGVAAGFDLGYQRYGEVDSTFADGGSGASVQGTRTYSSWQTTAGLMLHHPRGHWRPYGVLGAGAYGYRIADEAEGFSSVDQTPRFGVNAGGGLRWVGGHGPWGVGLEARWHGIFEALDGRNVNAVTVLAGVSYSPGGIEYED